MRSLLVVLLLAPLVAALPARAAQLSLVCLDVGRALETCRDAGRRFAEASGHTVSVIAADATSRDALEHYLALFNVDSPRLDVIQFPDSWVPALARHLTRLGPAPDEAALIPAAAAGGRVGGRVVGWPQHASIALLYLRAGTTLAQGDPSASLREGPGAAPLAGGLAVGAAGPALFPLFVNWVYGFGAESLDDRAALEAALGAINRAMGTLTSPSVAATSSSEAVARFVSGASAALVAPSVALPSPQDGVGEGEEAVTVEPLLPRQAADAPVKARLMLSTWYVGVPRDSPQQAPARELAAFLVSQAEQRRAALAGALAPTLRPLYREAAVRDAAPAFAQIAAHLSDLAPPPVARYGTAYLDLADAVAEAVRAMLRGEASREETVSRIVREVRRARQADAQQADSDVAGTRAARPTAEQAEQDGAASAAQTRSAPRRRGDG